MLIFSSFLCTDLRADVFPVILIPLSACRRKTQTASGTTGTGSGEEEKQGGRTENTGSAETLRAVRLCLAAKEAAG